MSSSFTARDGSSSTSVQPFLVTGYEASREVRNVFNPVLGADATVAVAFPAGLRSGQMTAVFNSRYGASFFDNMLKGTSVITFTDSDNELIGMTFLPDQTIRLYPADDDTILDDGSSTRFWYLEFGYQEVSV